MGILNEIQSMSQEERRQLAELLKENPQPVPTRELGTIIFPEQRARGPHGELFAQGSEEEWDVLHPLRRKPYGYTETGIDMTGRKRTKSFTREEIDEMNRPAEEAWLEAKRKKFPNAILPPNLDLGRVPSRYQEAERG